MKRIFIVIALAVIGLTGCQKEPETKKETETEKEPETNALRFTANAGQSISLISSSPDSPSVQYSYDCITWTDWDHSPLTFGTASTPSVYIRGNNPGGFSKPGSGATYFKFSTDAKVQCSGNIMHLLSYNEDLKKMPSALCFFALFLDCTCLETAPDLPATSLSTRCYSNMFWNCVSLKSAPELPASSLAESCYAGMFYGCTGLTDAPKIHATNLAVVCCQQMFQGCTSLQSAPELPATKLATRCYNRMFQNCTSLQSAPELPAAKLAQGCYEMMFSGCSRLACVKCLAEDDLSLVWGMYMSGWLEGVSSTGTFIKSPRNDTWTRGNGGIPSGWQVEDDK